MSVRSNDESIRLCENGRRCRHELALQCRTFSDLGHRNLLSKKESLSKKYIFTVNLLFCFENLFTELG